MVTIERSTLETLHIPGGAEAFIENKVDDANAWLKRRIELTVNRVAVAHIANRNAPLREQIHVEISLSARAGYVLCRADHLAQVHQPFGLSIGRRVIRRP